MKFINEKAKEEAKAKSSDQIHNVRQKIKKWSDRKVFGGYYKKAEPIRKEGEEWTDDEGKTWTVKNGVKQTISRHQDAKIPWWCPKCGRTLNHKIHEKFYILKGACHDCWIAYEGKMRVDGVYPAYERRMLRANERSWIADIIAQHLDYIENQQDMELHFRDGRWEVLADKSEFGEVKEKLRHDIQFMHDRLEFIQREEDDDKQNQIELEEWEEQNPWSG